MASRLRSPIIWFGGKGRMVTKLLPLFPPHKTYVEPFGGGASLLLAKQPSPIEVYNDIDSGLVNFYRVLRDKEKFERLHQLVSLTPYSREEYGFCRETWRDCENDVERAYRWYVVARMSFGGKFGHAWGFSKSSSCNGISKECHAWLSIIEMLPEIHKRIMEVQIEHVDFRRVFKNFDSPWTLFYCDPPYVHSTRSNMKYEHELTDSDHKDLVNILLGIKGMAILSGYRNDIYTQLETAGWKRYDFQASCSVLGRTKGTGVLGKNAAKEKGARVESAWISPSCFEEHNDDALS